MLGRPAKLLTEQQIRHAMKRTRSNRAAARYLNVSYPTYKLYAKQYYDQESGKNLYDLHLNPFGKGISKWRATEGEKIKLQDLLKEGMSVQDRKSTRLNSSHLKLSRMPSSA